MQQFGVVLGVLIVLGKMIVLGVIPTVILMLISYFAEFNLPPVFFMWTVFSLLSLPLLMKLDDEPTTFY
jgi:hypothetical protein